MIPRSGLRRDLKFRVPLESPADTAWKSSYGRDVSVIQDVEMESPVCFKHELKSKKPPVAYKNQANAWFTREITEWWILNVF
jgi:hypothetical protein